MNTVKLSLAVFLLSAALPAYSVEFQCPDNIAVVETPPTAPPAGWATVFMPHTFGYSFHHVGIFDEHPSKRYSLVPDDIERKGLSQSVWGLSSKNPRDYWLACHYNHTNVLLSRRLPAGLSNCTATYKRKLTKLVPGSDMQAESKTASIVCK